MMKVSHISATWSQVFSWSSKLKRPMGTWTYMVESGAMVSLPSLPTRVGVSTMIGSSVLGTVTSPTILISSTFSSSTAAINSS